MFGPQASSNVDSNVITDNNNNMNTSRKRKVNSTNTNWQQISSTDTDRGIIPRAVDQLFETIIELQKTNWSYSFRASMIEIYNEIPRCLLNNNSSSSPEIKIQT